jgi:hypothetical protein
MSKNREQDQLVEQTEAQRNPGSARATDFKIEERDGGQRGDSKAERAALVAASNNEPIPVRNEVPPRRYPA